MLADGRPADDAASRNPTATVPARRRSSMAPAMTTTKRIGILTGGGDVPGLNAVIKSVVYRATEAGYDVLGIRRGWEGLTHVRPGRPDPDYLRPLDRINTRTIDRTGGTILHTSRTNPRKMRAAGLPPWMDEAARARYAVGDGVFDLTPLVLDNLGGARDRPPGHDRRRRHAVVLAGPGQRGRPAGRDPQDDGQRRPGDRVLHRLLDGDHPGQGGDQSPADDAGQPRADRRLPDLRARRRLLGAVHGLRDVGPLRHPRGALRPRRAGRAAGRRPRREPEPLRLRDHRRRRHLARRPDEPMSARRTRSAIATRPTSARRWPTSCGLGPGSRRWPPS